MTMKNILITGANGYLGSACVKLFLQNKYRVLALDHSNSHLGEFTASPGFRFYSLELTDEESVDRILSEILSEFGSIHAALLIAGGFALGTLTETRKSDFQKQISLNFESAYYVVRNLLHPMKEGQFGRFIFIGARPALSPEQGQHMMSYALSKSLLFRLAEMINAQCRGTNVTATVLVPSTLDTPANRSEMPQADFSSWVQPLEVAKAIEFICGEDSPSLRESVWKLYNNS
jgi:NAD(P)-dependent dehydrogenase (short-subunit alcohol dehydrogenase family)